MGAVLEGQHSGTDGFGRYRRTMAVPASSLFWVGSVGFVGMVSRI
jgi:hypothetical protein